MEEAKYDILEITDKDSMYHEPCKEALVKFNSRCQEEEEKVNLDAAMSSKGILAIEIDVYLTNKSEKAVMCVLNGILILLYKRTAKQLILPFKIDDVSTLIIADNVPSAAALVLSETVVG